MTAPLPSVRRAAAKEASTTSQRREIRNQALANVKRDFVLDAARSAFFELGMEKASIREIAQRAGYAPGAIYKYFASKEQIYGALLGESLERLNTHVQLAVQQTRAGPARMRAAASAFFDFYRANPRDLDLGFYLFQGMKPRGLTPELNKLLNMSLLSALQPAQTELEALGMAADMALQEITSLFAHAVGLLVMSHTGRIRMFKQASLDLFNAYLDQLEIRAKAGAGT